MADTEDDPLEGLTRGAAAAAGSPGRMMPDDSVFAPTVSVIIPTVASPSALTDAIDGTIAFLNEYGVTGEVLVCADPESDIAETARDHGAVVVVSSSGAGYGAAVRAAITRVRGDYVAIGDATGAYEFSELPMLFSRLEEGAQLVIGRRVNTEEDPNPVSVLRRALSRPVRRWVFQQRYGATVSDPSSGLRAFREGAKESFSQASDGRGAAAEMVRDAAREGLRVEEVPISYRRDADRRATGRTSSDLIAVLENAPSDLFTVAGLVAMVVGVLLMAGAFFAIDLSAVSFGPRSMLAGSLLALGGHQFVNLGLFTWAAGRPSQRSLTAVTAQVGNRLTPGRAVSIGLILIVSGAAYTAYLLATWITVGYPPLVEMSEDLLAVTAILLGFQVIAGGLLVSSS